jgi:Fur family ferric uptake transcriptional regulator
MVKNTATSKPLPCGRPKPLPTNPPPSAKQFEVWRNQLKDYLVSQGLKFTEQRWKIAELILSTGGHLDAQALVEQVKKRHAGIGAATVYRSIKVLCDAAILKESLIDVKGRVFYELFDKQHHDHIICLDCGEIFEFHDQKIESQQSAVVQKMQFEEVGHRHIVYTRCTFNKNPSL